MTKEEAAKRIAELLTEAIRPSMPTPEDTVAACEYAVEVARHTMVHPGEPAQLVPFAVLAVRQARIEAKLDKILAKYESAN